MLLLVVNDRRAFAFPLARRHPAALWRENGMTTSAPGKRSSQLLLVYVSHVGPWNFRSKPPRWRLAITAAPKTPHTVLHHGTHPEPI
jgi:hypothetical protein